jgi:integrase
MKRFPPVEITLPWKVADGPLVTRRLIFTGPRGGHIWRTSFNEEAWKPAPAASGPSRSRSAASLMPVKALAEYLGHSDPGLTLRVYAHLMPSSQERTRKAVAQSYEAFGLSF